MKLPVRAFFSFERPVAAVGHLVSTYDGDGDPLPSFSGEPRPVEIADDIDETAELYWRALNADNKVSLLVKTVHIESGASDCRIVNKHRRFP